MECRSLGESKSNYTTHEAVRQIRQQSGEYKSRSGKGKSRGGNGAVALGLLAGAAAGALAGVLLAPEKGTVIRKKVTDQATKLGDQVNKGYSTTKSKVSDWTGKTKGGGTGSQTEGSATRSPYEDTNRGSMGNANDIPPAM